MPKKPRFHLFSIHHSTKHIPGPFARNILHDGQTTSIFPRIAHNHQTRDRSALWISIMGNTSLVKRVVRSKVTRKMRLAFTSALEQAGYSSEGRSLNSQTPNLVGSVTFVNLQFMDLLRQQSELESEMMALVQMLVTKQGQTGDAAQGAARARPGANVLGATKSPAENAAKEKKNINRGASKSTTATDLTREGQSAPMAE